MKRQAGRYFSRRLRGISVGCALVLIGSAYAVWQRNPDIVGLLLQRGADVNTINISEVIVASDVPRLQRLEVLRLLKQAGART